MRNLILLSIVVALGVIGFYVYTEIERAQLIKELSQNTMAFQPYISDESQGLAITSEDRAEQVWQNGTQGNGVGSPADVLESTPEDNLDLSEWDLQELEPTEEAPLLKTDNNSLPSEVEELFSKYSKLDEEVKEITVKLTAVQLEDISIMNRVAFITNHEIDAADDPATEKKLAKERDALFTRGKELVPTILDLQDKEEQLFEDQESLLRDYGFSSFNAFLQTHGEAYKVWKSTR